MKTKKYFLYHIEPENLVNDFDYCSVKKFIKLKNHTIDEIFIADLLDNLSKDNQIQLINDIKNKLKPNGYLYIQSLDMFSIAASVITRQIDLNFLNNILFANNRKSLSYMSDCIMTLKKNNFIIEQSKFTNGIQYFIKAKYNAK